MSFPLPSLPASRHPFAWPVFGSIDGAGRVDVFGVRQMDTGEHMVSATMMLIDSTARYDLRSCD